MPLQSKLECLLFAVFLGKFCYWSMSRDYHCKGVAPCLTYTFCDTPERICQGQHSSLYFGSVGNEEKSLITLTTGVSVVNLFSSSLKLQQSKLVFTWQAHKASLRRLGYSWKSKVSTYPL